jgi:hypothetical protein
MLLMTYPVTTNPLALTCCAFELSPNFGDGRAGQATALRASRVGEFVIETAIAQEPGMLRLQEFAGTRLATASANFAGIHRDLSVCSSQSWVPCY